MSDLLVFGFGTVIFIVATWATLSFGLARVQELALKDVEESERFRGVKKGTYADVYVTQPLPGEQHADGDIERAADQVD